MWLKYALYQIRLESFHFFGLYITAQTTDNRQTDIFEPYFEVRGLQNAYFDEKFGSSY